MRHLLAVEAYEIHRIEQEWWKAAIADRGGDDFARKREEKPRAFDQYDRVHALLRDIPNAKHAGKFQFETEQ